MLTSKLHFQKERRGRSWRKRRGKGGEEKEGGEKRKNQTKRKAFEGRGVAFQVGSGTSFEVEMQWVRPRQGEQDREGGTWALLWTGLPRAGEELGERNNWAARGSIPRSPRSQSKGGLRGPPRQRRRCWSDGGAPHWPPHAWDASGEAETQTAAPHLTRQEDSTAGAP